MIEYMQILVALGAILLEYENFSHAKELFEAKEKRTEVWKGILKRYPLLMITFLSVCSLMYLVLSVVWVFSPVPLVRTGGIVLLGMSLLGLGLRKFGLERLWNHPIILRINAAVCMGWLSAIAFVKGIALWV